VVALISSTKIELSTLKPLDGNVRALPGKGAFLAPPGSVIDMITPDSDGFGPVSERDPTSIGRDLADGYVTVKRARDDYGIADAGAPRARPPGGRTLTEGAPRPTSREPARMEETQRFLMWVASLLLAPGIGKLRNGPM
jgi:hypothetical protein